VSLTAWRICKQKHCKHAFTGEGARLFGGRWNNPGTAVVYVAGSQALATLEMLVQLNAPDLLGKYVLIPVEIETGMIADLPELPDNWKIYPAPAEIRQIGDDWVVAQGSVALRVPSTLVPSENNFLLNPRHEDFPRLKIGKPLEFEFDSRFRKPAKPKVL
jgi:RES domain-containing protein